MNRIAELIKTNGRLVMVSSAGHRGADVDLNDPNLEYTPYDPLAAYRMSKTANILFAVEFDRRRSTRGVRATAVHQGAALKDTTRKLIEAQPSAVGFRGYAVNPEHAKALWSKSEEMVSERF